jgi:16S rRNA (guanine(966)-N(2))-methyltransferase RsmD
LRIVSGYLKGRSIIAPSNIPTRPTTDFAKEGLFNLFQSRLNKDFEDLDALDLFAGTGNISYELASRGGRKITSVEIDFKCYEFIKKTIANLNIEGCKVIRNDVFLFLKICKVQFDLIFADPPYEMKDIEKIHRMVMDRSLLKPGGILVIEHGSKTNLSKLSNFIEQRNYGNVNFSIFECKLIAS